MNNVLKELQDTETELIQVISSINEDQFNTIPFEGSWTAAQVGEHIFKFVNADVLYGDTKPTDREPDEKVAETAKLFLNMDIKMKSPDFILPSDTQHTKRQILNGLDNRFTKLTQAIKELDLSATCLAFDIPGFGEFTRLEFVWFFIIHTQRHIHQLKNIVRVLTN